MTPQTMYFFRDELEKQALFTPASAVKAMKYAKPGMLGDAVRQAGRFGAGVQRFGAAATPALEGITGAAQYGPEVLAGTVKGLFGKELLRRVPTPSFIPAGVGKRAKSALTWESRNSPLATSYNPADLSNFIPTPSF